MKKILVITIAVVLCLTVIGLAFAVVKSEPEDKVISITAGNSATLTIDGLTGGTINPDTPVVKSIRLYNTQSANLEGTGTLTIVATGDLAPALNLSWQVGASAAVNETTLATGVSYELTSMPIDGTLTISYDTGCNYATYAELTATITISFEYDTFAPVDGAYYVIGDFNGWDLNKYAILLDGTPFNTDKAFKSNVALTAGGYKAIQYTASTDSWAYTNADSNFVIDGQAAGYDIYVNDSNAIWIQAHVGD